ncbi:hypothetical protein CARUB_v10015021mg [Capsella rubella]|uniref:Uncharacterized protein n=1 Tax=Capsella rubella TaxID=81985 RepID=R0HPV2_9BRAS|nr:hypothetical protein CARUB_v10015021mg [Capsella rubella]EOA31799.1 hypothetical protein CARUB_v10015021mg [Capsella rubella]
MEAPSHNLFFDYIDSSHIHCGFTFSLSMAHHLRLLNSLGLFISQITQFKRHLLPMIGSCDINWVHAHKLGVLSWITSEEG